MKNILFILAIALSTKLFSQSLPSLSENEFIQQKDLKKKVGWIKVKIDSNFRITNKEEIAKYVFYDFCDKKGNLFSRGDLIFIKDGFDKKYFKVKYTKLDTLANSKLLNGKVEFYNKKHKLKLTYILKDGFLKQIYGYSSKGVLKYVTELIPTKTTVELYINYFKIEEDGALHHSADSHGIYDGYKWTQLPGYIDIKRD